MKKRMKRITALALAAMMTFSLAACGSNGKDADDAGKSKDGKTTIKITWWGGPLDSTLSYVLYLYRRAFNYFDMGYSCALAWVLVLIIAVFTVILFKTQKSWVYYESGGDE